MFRGYLLLLCISRVNCEKNNLLPQDEFEEKTWIFNPFNVKNVIEKEKENHALVLLIEGGDRVLEWDPESMIIFKEIIRGQKPTINLNDYVLSQYCESSCWTSSLYLRTPDRFMQN
jgi:hypothetical protein